MQIDCLDFTLSGRDISISDGVDIYANVFYPTRSPVCDEAEDYFARLEAKGDSLIIDKLFKYHPDARVSMIVQNLRTKALRVLQYSANILQKQRGDCENGIIIGHPLFNGFICRSVPAHKEGQIRSVFRPFQILNCKPTPPYNSPAPRSDGRAFYNKYIGGAYNFPHVEVDHGTVYQMLCNIYEQQGGSSKRLNS